MTSTERFDCYANLNERINVMAMKINYKSWPRLQLTMTGWHINTIIS